MARSHARLLATIWADDDFLALPPGPQRMYMFLISQQDLQHCGVIALRERRWSKKAAGLTVEDVQADLKLLADRRFVVIDEDAEELLVRSLMRRDKVYAQPNVFKAAAEQIRAITSPEIRAVLLEELKRLPVEELKDDSRDVLGDLIAVLTKICGRGSATPSPTPSEQVPSEPRGKGSGYGGEVEDSPSPGPLPVPPPAGAAAPRPAAPRRTKQPDQEFNAGDVVAAWIDAVTSSSGERPANRLIAQIGRQARELLDEGKDPDRLIQAASDAGRKGYADLGRELLRAGTTAGRDSPPPSRNSQILDAAMQRAIAAEQQMNIIQPPRGAISA